jgi:hypothetical protein
MERIMMTKTQAIDNEINTNDIDRFKTKLQELSHLEIPSHIKKIESYGIDLLEDLEDCPDDEKLRKLDMLYAYLKKFIELSNKVRAAERGDRKTLQDLDALIEKSKKLSSVEQGSRGNVFELALMTAIIGFVPGAIVGGIVCVATGALLPGLIAGIAITAFVAFCFLVVETMSRRDNMKEQDNEMSAEKKEIPNLVRPIFEAIEKLAQKVKNCDNSCSVEDEPDSSQHIQITR